MGTLSDLQKSIQDMSYDELLEFHRQIRGDRKIVTKPARVLKKNQSQTKSRLSKLLSGLSEEEKIKLLKGLKDE